MPTQTAFGRALSDRGYESGDPERVENVNDKVRCRYGLTIRQD
jgi:hypothetical protein